MPRWPEHLTAAERVLRRTSDDDGCWVFAGSKNWDGYGMVKNPQGSQMAHRVVYEALVGPIPEGYQLDHLCRNPACVNPEHLEPVTQQENIRRGLGNWRQRAKTHCPQGHPYDEANTLLNHHSSGQGRKRACRTCVNARRARRRAARKAVILNGP